MCSEKEIIAIMRFTGFTRQECLDYLKDLGEKDTEIIISLEQESQALDQFALLILAA
jgi:hypothetical protein